MNGSFPFVYIATCGCVVSQAGLKALAATSTTPPASEDKDKGEEKDNEPRQLDLCPQCGEKYDRLLDVRMINPDTETEALMRSAMEARKRKEKEKGKSGKGDKKSSARKRKAGDADAEPEPVLEAKKAKASTANKVQPAPSLNPTIAAASRAIAASLAQEEAKRKAGMSDAVKSLYEGKANATKETFMTRGTFTRVSNHFETDFRFRFILTYFHFFLTVRINLSPSYFQLFDQPSVFRIVFLVYCRYLSEVFGNLSYVYPLL